MPALVNLDTDFAGDDGAADATVRSALAAFAAVRTHESVSTLLNEFGPSRVLVPVIAVADAIEDGVDKDSHMRQVDFTATDGRRALLAFSGTDSLALWDPNARPVPRRAFIAAQSVLEADYDALIVDLAGPVPVAIDGAVLARMAVGPNYDEALVSALDRCCARIEQLPGVIRVTHRRDAGGVHILVEADQPDASLAEAIPAALDDPALTVLLDVALSLEVLPQVTSVR